LESTINWLNIWEQNNKDGKISDDEFLTRPTAEGLRVTLQSTIDLSKYLLSECGYHYVLSNKFNQDQIEVKLILNYYFNSYCNVINIILFIVLS